MSNRAAERAVFNEARKHGLRRRHARKLRRIQENEMSEPRCAYVYDEDVLIQCERVPVDGGRYCRRHRWLEDQGGPT